MQFSNKTKQDSCFNSRCSDGFQESSSALYEAITKNLHNEYCPEHHLAYQYFYEKNLLCRSCFLDELRASRIGISCEDIEKYEYLYNLKSIMKYPLILLANHEQLFQCPTPLISLILNSYHPLFNRKSDFTVQRQLLITFTTRIKGKINTLCDSLLANFDAAEHLGSINEYRDQLKHISKMYEQQFEELLGQRYIKGSKQQIQEMLNDYRCNNENPFDKIFRNLDEVMSHLSQSSIINTQQLVKLYTTITDDRLWRCNQIITTKAANQSIENNDLMILNNEEVVLQNEYVLQNNTDEGLVLKKENVQLGRLRQSFDSLYHLNKYRLIGVTYQSIQIINYFDRLKIDEIFHIEGCTDILPFENHIMVISNQNLIRIDLISKRQATLSTNCKQLRYDHGNSQGFICETTEGRRMRWNLRSNEPFRQFPI